MGYTKHVDKESRNSESTQPTDLLFLFYPPFSNLCSESAKRRRLVSPNERRRFALRPDRTGPDEGDAPRLSCGCIPGSVQMRAGAQLSGGGFLKF